MIRESASCQRLADYSGKWFSEPICLFRLVSFHRLASLCGKPQKNITQEGYLPSNSLNKQACWLPKVSKSFSEKQREPISFKLIQIYKESRNLSFRFSQQHRFIHSDTLVLTIWRVFSLYRRFKRNEVYLHWNELKALRNENIAWN